MTKSQRFFPAILLFLFLSACSNNNNQTTSKKVITYQTGTVVAVIRSLEPKQVSYPNSSNVGISIGSGGHAGIYGAVDFATLGRLFNKPKAGTMMQQIIVKRPDGSFVEITQPAIERFKSGEKIRIIRKGNEARVIH